MVLFCKIWLLIITGGECIILSAMVGLVCKRAGMAVGRMITVATLLKRRNRGKSVFMKGAWRVGGCG